MAHGKELPIALVACALGCGGKATAGYDGGGSCGNCSSGEACDAGQCGSCTPNCPLTYVAGLGWPGLHGPITVWPLCGDPDGCGGRCTGINDQCPGGGSCSNGTCGPTCAPDCSGKACGNDGCGGSCGNCTGSSVCDVNQCIDQGVDAASE